MDQNQSGPTVCQFMGRGRDNTIAATFRQLFRGTRSIQLAIYSLTKKLVNGRWQTIARSHPTRRSPKPSWVLIHRIRLAGSVNEARKLPSFTRRAIDIIDCQLPILTSWEQVKLDCCGARRQPASRTSRSCRNFSILRLSMQLHRPRGGW